MMRIANLCARTPMLAGLGLIALYCGLATSADAITRTVAQGFAAPQLYCLSGGVVVMLCLLVNASGSNSTTLRTVRPRTLGARSVFFIVSSVSYFYAFRALPFAEVFVFIAMVPIFAGLLSGPVLGEPVRWQSWCALLAGLGGMLLLYPAGPAELSLAHLSACIGAFSGACAMVLARHISRDEPNALLQVLYPNLAMCLVMACFLPFDLRPMGLRDLGLVLGYATVLFLARWVLVMALARVKAYVVTLLMNFQFVLMLVVGALLFDERASLNLIAGASIIILSGSYLFFQQLWDLRAARRTTVIKVLASH